MEIVKKIEQRILEKVPSLPSNQKKVYFNDI